MKKFFKVTSLPELFKLVEDFPVVDAREAPAHELAGRILAEHIKSDADLPDFARSTMDGYGTHAASTFGASQGNPAFLKVTGGVLMGAPPDFSIKSGEAAKISTGGMLPEGADSVVMLEHSEVIDDETIEVCKAVAPGDHIIAKGEDFGKGDIVLSRGMRLRPQDIGLLAAFGKRAARIYKRPKVAIISTGDEIVPPDKTPGPGQIRDINTHTLSSMIIEAGGIPKIMGIVPDSFSEIKKKCLEAFHEADMTLISGGSSVGARDYALEAISAMPESKILAHGISISPGKPTILAVAGGKPFWGLPGHVASTMVVFDRVVRPFLEHAGGLLPEFKKEKKVFARLARNVSSSQGRVDYIRVRLKEKGGVLFAEPVLGKSGLINTMIRADGLMEIGINTEGMEKGAEVSVVFL